MSERIRISQPQLGAEEERLVVEVLRSGHLAQGPMVLRFEQLCAAMAGTAHAVAVANGTVALQAALIAAGVQPGDEVITSPFTFAATLNAILRCGATARFADIDGDFTMAPESAAGLVNERSRVLMPVHLYGLMADMEALQRIAASSGCAVIEDAAQAHGATQGSHRAGSFGIGCFSFYATKNVTSGEGGCITTDDDSIDDVLRVLRNQGMRSRYEYDRIGENWRMTDIAAAVAIPQLQRLDDINARRAANATRLTAALTSEPSITVPLVPEERTHVWHQYTVLLPEGCDRARVIASLDAAGIDAGVYYPKLVWDYDAYREHPLVRHDATPRAAAVVARCLSLPVHPALSDADLDRVAETLLTAVRAA
jgi:perosamine synthetase